MTPRTIQSKIRTLQEAAAEVATLRKRGATIVWTNGCFDLLHKGHVGYLQQARQLGDVLLVGINSDASVRRLKGPMRPVVSFDGRAAVVAALESVDIVVGFDQDTPLEPILRLQPNIVVKGGDYKREDVVGAEEAPSWGGRVEILPFAEGWSTSKILDALSH